MIPGITASRVAAEPSYSFITEGIVAVLDAQSYSSGQLWDNQVASPADGSAQTDYDFWLGTEETVTARDPTFQNLGLVSAYAAFDGNDLFTLAKLSAAASPAFITTMNLVGAKYTLEFWVWLSGNYGSNVHPYFDSGTQDFGGTDVSRGIIFADIGAQTSDLTAGHLNFRVQRDSGGSSALLLDGDNLLPTEQIIQIAVSYDSTGAEPSFLYSNGDYEPVGGNNTWSGVLNTPGVNPAVQRARIGARGDTNFSMPPGNRIYIARFYNRNLSKAELDSNWHSTRVRFGLPA